MIEVIKKVPKGEYWCKSEAFLLPLTGMAKSQKYPVNGDPVVLRSHAPDP